MKAFTDIEQSKKLAEFLPIESADMYWWATSKRYYIEAMDDGDFNEREGHIRAWSLAALLSVIPSGKALIHDKGDLGYKCICNNMDTYFHDNPVDACVEMIIRLNELKLL